MIEKIWLRRSLFAIILLPLAIVYGLLIEVRRFCYYLGILPSWKSKIPIIIVGNLTVGGNGKTPVVIWLVEQLISRGFRVGVVSRGYGSKAKIYPLLVNNNVSIIESGDEPALIYRRTGVPVVISPKRIAAVKMLINHHKLDLIITDDGLQHYALHRDYEIVVIDGMHRFGNGWLLPAGPLRELKYRLNIVDAIITITNGNFDLVKSGEIAMELVGDIAINMLTGERIALVELQQVIAIAGIRHPTRFFVSLKQKGVQLIGVHSFPDHQYYEFAQLSTIVTNQQNLLMTEKDAVKCFNFAMINWWYLPVNAKIYKNGERKILSSISKLVEYRLII